MPASEEVSDPTDWLNTAVSKLEPVEAGLRCEICKDFYTAPVLTACYHTFCSGCIRRSLSAVNASRKCPLCWAPFDEGQLRKNMIVEDLVAKFQAARPDILALAKATAESTQGEEARSRKRKLDEVIEGESQNTQNGAPSPRKTRSYGRHSQTTPTSTPLSQSIPLQHEDIEDTKEDGDYQPGMLHNTSIRIG
jgi:E3 ubiquitin-protein ligase RAD18